MCIDVILSLGISRKKTKRPKTQESSLSADLEEEPEEEKSQMDPFSLQERIFSRYASMLYASDNNGKTFHEFKDAEYCKSCGEKVKKLVLEVSNVDLFSLLIYMYLPMCTPVRALYHFLCSFKFCLNLIMQ